MLQRAAVGNWSAKRRSHDSQLLSGFCFIQRASFVFQQLQKHSMWTPLFTACALVFLLCWEAVNAVVVDFDAELAGRHRTRRLAALAVVSALPVADVSHLVPPGKPR